MLLAGTYDLVIDTKHRLSIPFTLRRKLGEHAFYVVPGRRPGTLSLYPESYYEELRKHEPPDERLSDGTFAFREFEFSQSALLNPDNQGRLLLPDRLLERVGLTKEVVLIAVRDHLELWSREEFEEFEREMWASYPLRRSEAQAEMNRLAGGSAVKLAGTMTEEPPEGPGGL